MCAIVLIVIASKVESRQSTIADAYLDAIAWLIAGITLSVVVARRGIRSGKDNLPSDRRRYSSFSTHWTDVRSVVPVWWLLTRQTRSRVFKHYQVISPLPETSVYLSFVTLTTIGYGDIRPIASLRPRPCKP